MKVKMNKKGVSSTGVIISIALALILLIIIVIGPFETLQEASDVDLCKWDKYLVSANYNVDAKEGIVIDIKDIDKDRLPDECDYCVCTHKACGNLSSCDVDNDGVVDACDSDINDIASSTKKITATIKEACNKNGGALVNVGKKNLYGVQCKYVVNDKTKSTFDAICKRTKK